MTYFRKVAETRGLVSGEELAQLLKLAYNLGKKRIIARIRRRTK